MTELVADVTGLRHLATPGRRGRSAGAAGVTVSLVDGRSCAMVIARKGQMQQLDARVREAYGVAMPEAGRSAGTRVRFVALGPGQWLALHEGGEDGAAFESELRAAVAGGASVSDQTDARVSVRVGGERVRDLLAKLVPIDLDPRAFPPGSAASSVLGHISATVVRSDQSPTFEILVSRSYAESFWRAMVAAGAEFGIDVV